MSLTCGHLTTVRPSTLPTVGAVRPPAAALRASRGAARRVVSRAQAPSSRASEEGALVVESSGVARLGLAGLAAATPLLLAAQVRRVRDPLGAGTAWSSPG